MQMKYRNITLGISVKMMEIFSRILLWTCTVSFVRSDAVEPDTCTYVTYMDKLFNISEVGCPSNSICKKTFNVTYIDFPPYFYKKMKENENRSRYEWQKPIHQLLRRCCGYCTKINENFLRNISEATLPVIKSSDFIYPFFASSLRKSLYGHHYVALIDIPDIMYVSVQEAGNVSQLFSHVFPISIVCVLLSLVAGFICWVLETWSNEQEFSRSFLIGWYEGIWWSFITMTTVGYGDKAPKTIFGRIFSMIWISIGVIVSGLVIGMVAAEVAKVNTPPPPQMKGMEIASLLHRDYDHLMAVKNGGIVIKNKESETKDFTHDVLQLVYKLQQGTIAGFVLDEYTLGYVIFHMELIRTVTNNSRFIELGDYYTANVIGTKVAQNAPNQFTYGVLIKNHQDYLYFQQAIQDLRISNQLEYASVLQRMYARKSTKFYMAKNDLFSLDGTYFNRTLKVIFGIAGLICLFGLVFELNRRCELVRTYDV